MCLLVVKYISSQLLKTVHLESCIIAFVYFMLVPTAELKQYKQELIELRHICSIKVIPVISCKRVIWFLARKYDTCFSGKYKCGKNFSVIMILAKMIKEITRTLNNKLSIYYQSQHFLSLVRLVKSVQLIYPFSGWTGTSQMQDILTTSTVSSIWPSTQPNCHPFHSENTWKVSYS